MQGMQEGSTSKANEIAGVILIGLAALCAVTMYFGMRSAFGDAIQNLVFGLGGVLGYLVPVLLAAGGVLAIAARHTPLKPAKWALLLGCVFIVFAMFHLGVTQYISMPGHTYGEFLEDSYAIGSQDRAGGGLFGGLLTYWTYTYLGTPGSWIVLVMGIAVCLLALTNLSIRKLSADLGTAVKTGYDVCMTHVEEMREHKKLYAEDLRGQSYAASGSDNPFDLQIQQIDPKKKAGGRRKANKERPLEPYIIGSGHLEQRRKHTDNLIDLSERRQEQRRQRTADSDAYNTDAYRKVFAGTDIQFDDDPVIETRGKRKLDDSIIPAASKPQTRRAIVHNITPKGTDGEDNSPFDRQSGFLGSLTVDREDGGSPTDPAVLATDMNSVEDALQSVIDQEIARSFKPDNADSSSVLSDQLNLDLYAQPDWHLDPRGGFRMPTLDTDAPSSGQTGSISPDKGSGDRKPRGGLTSPPLELEEYDAQGNPIANKNDPVGRKKSVKVSASSSKDTVPAGAYHVTTEQNRPGTAAVLSAEQDDSASITKNGLPPIDLLEKPMHSQATPIEELQASAAILEKTLRTFKIEARVVNILQGPVVTRFELELAEGIKVNRVVGLSDNLAMDLAATSVRIEAPVPGKSVIGIEIPNKKRQMVGLRELLESENASKTGSPIAFALGKDITGTPVIADIASMPHLLIAGQTGSGKSVCLNSLIASILFRATPEDVMMIMVDPKHVELSGYNNIPHLVSPVISDAKQAAMALNWAMHEQHTRYSMLESRGVRDIKSYNKLMAAEGGDKMPYLVVIVDEFAELMMDGDKEVESAIQSIAQLGRAGGIHLVLATQRPTTDVITGRIKANVPGRIAFSVRSQIDSRTILDCQGAEKLLGKGDMLYYKTGMSGPERLQGCNVTDAEIERVVDFWRAIPADPGRQIDFTATSDAPKSGSDISERDPRFLEAARIAVEEDKMSTSLLQRRLSLGYGRAAKLLDQMEAEGIISGPNGSKPRDVLMSAEEIEMRYGPDSD